MPDSIKVQDSVYLKKQTGRSKDVYQVFARHNNTLHVKNTRTHDIYLVNSVEANDIFVKIIKV